jgi:hypothetical protein
MSNILQLLTEYDDSARVTEQYRDRLTAALRPITSLLKINDDCHDSVYTNGKELIIEYSWSCHGGGNNNTVKIPLWVIESPDPAEAARTYMAQLQTQREERRREETLAQIEHLRKQLDYHDSHTMNIYATPGTRIVFKYPNNGHPDDRDRVMLALQVGQTYTVQKTSVGDWSSSVTLTEVPGVAFNTVMFDNE